MDAPSSESISMLSPLSSRARDSRALSRLDAPACWSERACVACCRNVCCERICERTLKGAV